MSDSPKAVRSRSRSANRSPLLRAPSKVRLVLDAQDVAGDETGESLVSPARTFSPVSAGKRLLKSSPRKTTRKKATKEGGAFSKYLPNRAHGKVPAMLTFVILTLAAACFFRTDDGPRLAKRDAPLIAGDRLKGGEYVTFCTSLIARGCKAKYLQLGRDGSLAVFGGSGPHARQAKLWSAGIGWKGTLTSLYELIYNGDRIIVNRDGKMKWSSSVRSLPKNLQPWPFAN